jgi:drug/metabolite transporter (DMT)-like permease
MWEKRVGVWQVWVAGAVMGAAFAIGFCSLIMHCLKIGPAGPTVTINNMAMVCGVLYGLLSLQRRTPNMWVIMGIAGTCIALALIGMGRAQEEANVHRVNRQWLRLVLLGGAFSGLSFMAQTHAGMHYPDHKFLFATVAFSVSALILASTVLARGEQSHQRERRGGICIGVLQGSAMPATLASINHIGPEVVLPVITTAPMVIMLIVGHFVYREHLEQSQWVGCVIGALSVVLLTYGNALASSAS